MTGAPSRMAGCQRAGATWMVPRPHTGGGGRQGYGFRLARLAMKIFVSIAPAAGSP